MRPPSPDCLFCRCSEGSFKRVEHPIPESLGNDDVTLEPGCVCDCCNQYFGSKLESRVLDSPPFSIERTSNAIRTKKQKLAHFNTDGIHVYSTGYWDHVLAAFDPEDQGARKRLAGTVFVTPRPGYGDLIVRFLLKIGLELLVLSDSVDPYRSTFDRARRCARFGESAAEWAFAYGTYPDRQDLKLSSRVDEFGPLETRQIYQYELGVMASGDVGFSFVFIDHVFACNLSRPPIVEYLLGFNVRNRFGLRTRWQCGWS